MKQKFILVSPWLLKEAQSCTRPIGRFASQWGAPRDLGTFLGLTALSPA